MPNRNQTRRSHQCRGKRPRNFLRTTARLAHAYDISAGHAVQMLCMNQRIDRNSYTLPTPAQILRAQTNTQLPWLRKMARVAGFGR